MQTIQPYDAVIVGGSFAGLSAAMSLGRALCRVLIIDAGEPCNRQTPHSHNFITHDGDTPAAIAAQARAQVLAYPTVSLMEGIVISITGSEGAFVISTADGDEYPASRVLLATGVKDVMPPIPGIAECWGISVLHCPYCHGYEVRNTALGIMLNSPELLEYTKMIYNWSPNLKLLTNGPATLTEEEREQLQRKGIEIIEQPVAEVLHERGQMRAVVLGDGSQVALNALFARLPNVQPPVVQQLAPALNAQGLIEVGMDLQTSIPGIYAAGDSTTQMRSVSAAVAAGTMAGAVISRTVFARKWNA
jgi:thioredoxin reductase